MTSYVYPQKIYKILFTALLFLTAVAVYVPFLPSMPSVGLDPSWVYGMNYALAEGFEFGKDIIFTFGPYASVYSKTYHPSVDDLMGGFKCEVQHLQPLRSADVSKSFVLSPTSTRRQSHHSQFAAAAS